MPNDWGNAIVVNPQELADERSRRKQYKREMLGWKKSAENRLVGGLVGWSCALVLCFGMGTALSCYRSTFAALQECHEGQRQSNAALEALARSHENLMDANAQIGTVGEGSWTRRFIVTKYVPTAGGINADSDPTHTATMWKANPKARIAAVDPTVIPYGSWLWVEDAGWFNAQDCGGAIKGFKIDLMGNSLKEAKQFGKRQRFVVVVPPKDNNGA